MTQLKIIMDGDRQVTSWRHELSFMDETGRQFEGTLSWNEHDGYMWHGDDLSRTSDLGAFLYALDEAATDLSSGTADCLS